MESEDIIALVDPLHHEVCGFYFRALITEFTGLLPHSWTVGSFIPQILDDLQ